MQGQLRVITKLKKKYLNDMMKKIKYVLSLLFCSISASTVFAQDSSTTVIREGVEIIICFPDSTFKRDTMSIEEWINAQPKDAEQRNKNLRQLNEQMKKPE